ncbi:MAG TPA: SagB family peptide dehydrogenase [Candidatus Hydrogenedens sp.]|nr:SagB family peptide dehydrogenase [Candidatus Hydrogenedens sp.]HOL19506.1 SagB family peptide dehydrogenase [Candidatus Hydrogenedens sp.]HPP59390.1 SagB family peptide dehydrogenase [Candidatus Hydrogenedens sp.]
MDNHLQIIYDYHEKTKHRPHRYARSLGYLDWDNEPTPFRTFEGSEHVRLSLPTKDSSPSFYKAFYQSETIPSIPMTIDSISHLLLYSLGISAWKEYRGSRWAVRCNPSSGNLHPTETYLIIPQGNLDHKNTTLYHYEPFEHILEKRAYTSQTTTDDVAPNCSYFYIALTSLVWREVWKYGERALRYCLLDIGHAIGAIIFSAMALGWRVAGIQGMDLYQLSNVLGLNRTEYKYVEKEFPQIILVIYPKEKALLAPQLQYQLQNLVFDKWHGIPSKVSPQTIQWEIIDKTMSTLFDCSTNYPWSENNTNNSNNTYQPNNSTSCPDVPDSPTCWALFRKRRSAHSFNSNATFPNQGFLQLLKDLHFANQHFLKPIINNVPRISLLFFIHNVENLESGIYTYVSQPSHINIVEHCLISEGDNITPILDNFPLYLCITGNCRHISEHLCCGQEIARDGVLCISMFTDVIKELEQTNGFSYTTLHWEAGFIGQLLYLEAELNQMSGTGIGCFFDDEIYKIKRPDAMQKNLNPLYYFTIGKAIPDPRIKTSPPYQNTNI